IDVVYGMAIIKKASAFANRKLGVLDADKAAIIGEVVDEILTGQWDEHFPLVVWQTGSGTQTNMNVNEVIANRSNQLLAERGSSVRIHPNDDVNRSQSSNDTFPAAMHIAGVIALEDRLLPSLDILNSTLHAKAEKFADLVKIGRTHLQDATPIT